MIKYLVTWLARRAGIHKSDVIDHLEHEAQHWKTAFFQERMKNWVLRDHIAGKEHKHAD